MTIHQLLSEKQNLVDNKKLIHPSVDKTDSIFIDATWLKRKMEEKNAKFTILEITENDDENSTQQHIPNALEFNTNDIESSPMWNLKNSKEIQKVIESKGISWNSLVILYGSNCLAVSRIAWTLFYAGVENVKILNGGIVDWKKKNFKTVNEYQICKSSKFGRVVPFNPKYNKSTSDIEKIVSNHLEASIICVRAEEEYKGEITGYEYVKYKGKIPNSIWGHDAKNWFCNVTNEFKAPEEIGRIWKEYGINDKNLIFYCGTGWRSSLAFIYAKDLGFENISNYDGSWHE